MGILRILELVFFIYFATHIPITIFLDSQAVAPREWYPHQLTELGEWYARELKDTYFGNPPVWYKSFVYFEQAVQLPFFFIAAYAFLKGGCTWIRTPAIIYGTHVATTVLPMIASFAFEDFRLYKPRGPESFPERMTLICIYMPYFIIPLLLLATMLISETYNGQVLHLQQDKSNKKKYYKLN